MIQWHNLSRPSIYRRIIGSFGLIILFILIAGVLNFLQVARFRQASAEAAPLSNDVLHIQSYGLLLEAVNSHLEGFYLVADPNGLAEVRNYLEQMTGDLNALKTDSPGMDPAELRTLIDLHTRLVPEVTTLAELLVTNPDARAVNERTRSTFTLIDQARAQQETLSQAVLNHIHQIIQDQDGIVTGMNAQLLVIAAATFMIALIASSYVSRNITGQLTTMAETATRVAGGDFSARVAVNTQDEAGQLATAFNAMTDRVQQSLKDLEEANRSLREASRLKDEFLAIMSHELRTPLNAIIGFQGIVLMSKKLDDRSAHMVQRSQANAERLLKLINDILDISRIESGRMQIIQADVPVVQVVEKWKSQMSVLAEEKGLQFEVQVDSQMPDTILTDEDAVTKIVTNLLGNAFKFTEQGHVSLNLKRSNGSWMIEVADTGQGIPAHMHEIIFERFRQVDGSSTRKHGGSGLGLAIVRNLCLAMNGTVNVKSAPGEGSVFTVTLPLKSTCGEKS